MPNYNLFIMETGDEKTNFQWDSFHTAATTKRWFQDFGTGLLP